MNDALRLVADLSIEKPNDTSSVADSAVGTSSIITEATLTGVSQFSEVRHYACSYFVLK